MGLIRKYLRVPWGVRFSVDSADVVSVVQGQDQGVKTSELALSADLYGILVVQSHLLWVQGEGISRLYDLRL